MQLKTIFNARAAWSTLSCLRKPPGIAYRLLRYERLVDAELATIDKARNDFIYKAAGVSPGDTSQVTLRPDTPELAAFASEFTAFLEGEAELQPMDLAMEELVSALDGQSGNVLAEGDLAALEPFFAAPNPS